MTVSFRGESFAKSIVVAVDGNGKFTAEVHAGLYWVTAHVGGKLVTDWGPPVVLNWGQHVHGLVLKPMSAEEKKFWSVEHFGGPERPISATTRVYGTVLDDQGRPVSGAKVYAAARFPGHNFMESTVETAVTDTAGRYSISGPTGVQDFSATVVAYKRGMASAQAWFASPAPPAGDMSPGSGGPTSRFVPSPLQERDLVLSRHGGRLNVNVSFNGAEGWRPGPGAA